MTGPGGEIRRNRWWRWLWRAPALVILLGFGWLWLVWPPPAWYRWVWPRETAFMALRRSEGATREARRYSPVPLSAIAPIMKDAALAGEDQRFYAHAGLDYVEFRHALGYRPDSFSWRSSRDRERLLRAVQQTWKRGFRVRGASTISQQLAKNLYLSPSRNPLRKLKEALLAWRLEYWLGKERILELYLNVAELGPGVWGVDAASRKYFGRPAARLTLEQAAALAATLPFPLSSNPEHRPGRMHWRQNMIIRWLRGEAVEIPRIVDSVPERLPDSLRLRRLDSILKLDSVKIRLDSVRDTIRPDTIGPRT